MVKVLVVAATGRTGRHVWRQALAAGHEVTCFVRNAKKMEMDVQAVEKKALAEIPRLSVVEGSLADAEKLTAAFQGQDCIISTIAHVKRTPEEEKALGGPAPKNHEMFRQILAAALGAKVKRFITTGASGPLSRRTPDGDFLMEIMPFIKNDPVFYDNQTEHIRNLCRLLLQDREKLEWTYVGLPVMTESDEIYALSGKVYTTQDIATKGSRSTYADGASVLVREISNRSNIYHRVGVATEGMVLGRQPPAAQLAAAAAGGGGCYHQ